MYALRAGRSKVSEPIVVHARRFVNAVCSPMPNGGVHGTGEPSERFFGRGSLLLCIAPGCTGGEVCYTGRGLEEQVLYQAAQAKPTPGKRVMLSTTVRMVHRIRAFFWRVDTVP